MGPQKGAGEGMLNAQRRVKEGLLPGVYVHSERRKLADSWPLGFCPHHLCCLDPNKYPQVNPKESLLRFLWVA